MTQILNWQEVQGTMFCLHSWVLCGMPTRFISTTLIDLLKILKLKYHCILTPENTSNLADQACYQIEQSTGLGPTILSQFELISSYLEANCRLMPVVLFPDSAHLRILNMRVCTKFLCQVEWKLLELPRTRWLHIGPQIWISWVLLNFYCPCHHCSKRIWGYCSNSSSLN